MVFFNTCEEWRGGAPSRPVAAAGSFVALLGDAEEAA